MMKKTVASRFKSKNADSSKGRTRSISSNVRPSRKRGTESISGSCEICGSTSWDSDEIRGETSCSDCGFVASEKMIDPGAEWVNHSNGDDRSRVGAPSTLTLSDKGLSTEIRRSDLTSGGARKHGLSGKSLRDWGRRQKIDQRSKTRDSRSRNLSVAMQFIRDRGDLPPQIEQEAASLYRHSVERGLVTGRSIRGVTAACVYIAAREAKIPRKIEDVGSAFDMTSDVEEKELKRTIRLVARNLGTYHITGPENISKSFTLIWTSSIRTVTSDLWVNVKDNLFRRARNHQIVEDPIFRLQNSDSRTQKEVCDVCGISEVTLRGR